MLKASLVFRNFSLLTAGKITGDLFTFVFFVAISRIYGDEGIGQYSIAIAITGFSMVFADFGLHFMSMKHLSRDPASYRDYFGRVTLLRVILIALSLLLIVPVLLYAPLSTQTMIIIVLVGLFQTLQTLVSGLAVIALAREDMYLASIAELVLKALIAAAGITIAALGGDLVTVVSVMPLITIAVIALTYRVIVRKYGAFVWRLSRAESKALLRDALPYGISGILLYTSMRADVVFLGLLLGEIAAGIYNVAYRVVFLLLFIPSYVSAAMLPALSRLYKSAPGQLPSIYQTSVNMILLIGLPASAGLWLIAEKLILLLYGEQFSSSVIVMKLIAWLLLFECITSIMGAFLMAMDRQHARTVCWGIAATIGIAGNLILIPRFGVIGAAIATLLSYAVLSVIFLILLRKSLGPLRARSSLLIAGSGSALFCSIFTLFPAPLLVTIPASAMIYGVYLLIFRGLIREEFNLMIKLARRER